MAGRGISNSTGSNLEKMVVDQLTRKGFVQVNYLVWERATDKTQYGDELLLCNVPFTNIYSSKSTTEFKVRSAKHILDIRIECKWQQSSGSVDEKLPYLYLNCIEAMPESHIIILIDGPGFRAGAIQWLRDAVKSARYQNAPGQSPKKIEIMSLSEFLVWINTTLS